MDILEKLFSNPGFLHVAEHVVTFMDNETIAQCRLVSKKSNNFLNNIWKYRMMTEVKRLCNQQFEYRQMFGIDEQEEIKVQTSIFEKWPDWNEALVQIQNFEDLSKVICLLKCYLCYYNDKTARHSPLHFAVFQNKLQTLKILLTTNLDFNTRDAMGQTILHEACWCGRTKDALELILTNSSEKGIDIKAVTLSQYNILHLSCDGNLEVAWFVLRKGEKYGLDISELANMTNRTGDKPIDIAKRTQELLKQTRFYREYERLIEELQLVTLS